MSDKGSHASPVSSAHPPEYEGRCGLAVRERRAIRHLRNWSPSPPPRRCERPDPRTCFAAIAGVAAVLAADLIRDDLQAHLGDSALSRTSRTGSQVGVDEGGCSPTRARARCSPWPLSPAPACPNYSV